jgi:CheY-like chemotaxis protein
MEKVKSLSALAVARRVGFLGTFDSKIEGLRREMERVGRAAGDPKAFGGRWPVEGLERIGRSLIGAGPVYGLNDVTDWARRFLTRLDELRAGAAGPSDEDMRWLAAEIQVFADLKEAALRETPHAVAQQGEARPETTAEPAASARAPAAIEETPPMPAAAVAFETPAVPAPALPGPRNPGSFPPPKRPADVPLTAAVAVAVPGVLRGIASALESAGFAILEVANASDALGLVRDSSPDLVVVDLDDSPPGGSALVSALKSDPLTDFLPILRIASATEQVPADVLPKPASAERVVAEMRRLVGPDVLGSRTALGLKDTDLDGMLRFVEEEVRAGLIEAASGPHTKERFRVTEEGPLIAAVWALVARLRKVAARASAGRIRFAPTSRGQIGMLALAESEGVLDPTLLSAADESEMAGLDGLRALVADDDAGVRSVFSRVLVDAGMRVRAVADGAEALREIESDPPDVIITDIVMPVMDGWDLCERLKRDYALGHIPIILLSWKEDFLEKLKGMNVAASDFLLKEADRQEILGRVASVLRPRLFLEARLRENGDVSGRVERLGMLTILGAAARIRPSCRITVRDVTAYYEADLRDGRVAAVSRTGVNGFYSSGEAGLARLVGVAGGRFSVIPKVEARRRQLPEGAEHVRNACSRLNALVAKVADGAYRDIESIDFDEEELAAYAETTPARLRSIIARLGRRDRTRDIALDKDTSPYAFEALLLDLIRAGVVKDIASRRSPQPLHVLANAPLEPFSSRTEPSDTTIPISLDDISMVNRLPPPAREGAIRRSEPPLPPFARARMQSARRWKALAATAFVLLALSLAANLCLWSACPAKAEAPKPAPAKVVPLPRPRIEAPKPAPVPEPPPAAPVAAPEQEPVPAPQAAPRQEEPRHERRVDREDRPRPATDAPSAPPKTPQKPAPAPGTGDGKLSVTVPPDSPGPVTVTVDGQPRGNAPLTIPLSAGLHEVVFSSQGKRTMRMVSIQADATKSVPARVVQ